MYYELESSKECHTGWNTRSLVQLSVRVSSSFWSQEFVSLDVSDILAHKPEQPFRSNLPHAGHPDEGFRSHLLEVKQGCEPLKLELS